MYLATSFHTIVQGSDFFAKPIPPPNLLSKFHSLSLSHTPTHSQGFPMASEGPAGILNYKVHVLKVSIHCEGCKKKIHRILSKIDGVYKVDIDAREKKVTVMASVDGDTLVRKLAKSSKYAELLPSPPPPPSPEKKVADSDGSNSKNEAKEPSETKEPPKPKQQQVNAAQKKPAKKAAGDAAAKADAPAQKTSDDAVATAAAAPAAAKPAEANKTEAAAEPAKANEEAEKKGKEPAKSDDNKAETSNPPPAKAANAEAKIPANEKAGSNGTAAASGEKASGGGKKKGKKAQKDGDGEAAAATRSADMAPDGPPPMAAAPYMYPYPVYAPPQHQHPAYVMSYNVAQPSVSHAYYAPAVPQASQGFVYHPYPPPAEFYYGPAAGNGSSLPHPHPYDMFSEENPNACNLM